MFIDFFCKDIFLKCTDNCYMFLLETILLLDFFIPCVLLLFASVIVLFN